MVVGNLTQDVLNVFEGICYVTDKDGIILAIGPDNWRRFAIENNAPSLSPEDMIGRSCFDFIAGEEVRQHFEDCLKSLSQSDFQCWTQPYRCDSPTIMRHMRFSISSLKENDEVVGFLHQSLQLSAIERPPLDIFDFAALSDLIDNERELDIVKMCSFCQKVNHEEYTNSVWSDAEEYYRAGGHSRVRVSHGICDTCSSEAELVA